MAASQLLPRQEFVVALDCGHFYLRRGDNDPEFMTLLERAQDADGIAQANGLLMIESTHQNNYARPADAKTHLSYGDERVSLAARW